MKQIVLELWELYWKNRNTNIKEMLKDLKIISMNYVSTQNFFLNLQNNLWAIGFLRKKIAQTHTWDYEKYIKNPSEKNVESIVV